MVTKKQADAALAVVTDELLKLSYDELKILGEQLSEQLKENPEADVREVSTEGGTAWVAMMIGELGIINKKICVELTLITKDEEAKNPLAYEYFERYKSGRLYVARAKRWDPLIPYLICGLGALALAYLAFSLARGLRSG